MMIRTFLLSLLALCAFPSSAATNVVTTIAEMYRLRSLSAAHGVNFDFTGTVSSLSGANDGKTYYNLRDRTDIAHFVNTMGILPRVGQVARVRGHSTIEPNGQLWLHVDHFEVVGSDTPPAYHPSDIDTILRTPTMAFSLVTVRGSVKDAYPDEVDEYWSQLILTSGGNPLIVAVHTNSISRAECISLVGAEIEVSGCVSRIAGERVFLDNYLSVFEKGKIKIINPAPQDPFACPPLETSGHPGPSILAKMGRHGVCGTVIAIWSSNKLMLLTDDRETVECTLSPSAQRFAPGTRIKVIGFPETNLYHLNLSQAFTRLESGAASSLEPAMEISADRLHKDDKGLAAGFPSTLHGKLVKLTGTVKGLPTEGSTDATVCLDCDNHLVSARLGFSPNTTDKLQPNSVVEITGVCVMECENWRTSMPFPQTKDIFLVIRSPEDIRVLAGPPWWTPSRFLIAITLLVLLLVGATIWNRALNRLVEKRTKSLLRERTAHAGADLRLEERTRLAVELHDSLSQNLSGVACQVAALKNVFTSSPSDTPRHLDTLERMLLSCRTELRRCLWDLRGDALETRDFEEAIAKTLYPILQTAKANISFKVRRADLADSVAHSVLCIIRELVANAVVHGTASSVQIAGNLTDGTLTFSVSDNGRGFDPDTAAGLSEGHFGLAGIHDRVKRLNGTFSISSCAGSGAQATVTIPLGNNDTP